MGKPGVKDSENEPQVVLTSRSDKQFVCPLLPVNCSSSSVMSCPWTPLLGSSFATGSFGASLFAVFLHIIGA